MMYVNDDQAGAWLLQLLRFMVLAMVVAVLPACGEDLTAEQHLEKAREFLAEEKLFEGIIELKNALQKEGNLPEARWLMGEAYLKLGNGALANREFTSARSLGYSHEDMDLYVFRALNLQGKYQEVLNKTDSLVASDNSAALQVIRGDAFLGLRQNEAAGEAYREAIAMDANTAAAYSGLARLALGSRDMEQSQSFIDRGLAVDPENDDLLMLKGLLHLIQNEAAEAEKYFSQASEAAPYNRMAKIGLIRARYAQGKFDEALPPLKTLESRYGNAPTVKYLRAYFEYQAKNVEKAKELLADVLKTMPSHPESLLLLSNILYQDGKLEQVIDYMERFTSQFPNHLPAVKLLAVAYLGQKETDKTIELIQDALETNTAD
ncbi:MAG: tetratricopeptide repeat protein, partial [Gammaproteobacteria bacterium]|nr:tetratricopeptide repeat protein [Gammaproteobacteria bacterium]